MRKPRLLAVALAAAVAGGAGIAGGAVAVDAPPALAAPASGAVPATTAAATVGWVPVADLRLDANRDGRVDITGLSDETVEAGSPALILPNLDDDGLRFRARTKAKRNRLARLSDARISALNDGADAKINGPADLLDLAPVFTPAQATMKADARGRLTIVRGGRFTHVFYRSDGRWRLVTAKTRFSAAQLAAGLRLAVEARDIVRDPAAWDGIITLRLAVWSSGGAAVDEVMLRVAPMLSSNHTQRATRVLVTKDPPESWARDHQRFNRSLEKVVTAAGVAYGELFTNDVWAQDFFEPMYASVPRGTGQQAMRLLLRCDQDRIGSRSTYRLRGRDIAVVWLGKPKGDGTLDSFGNLETIPPYANNGREFPAGRIIIGARPETNEMPSARLLRVLRAQGVQDPLLLNTSFLMVGHVDEIVQFLPAPTERGWRLAVADPEGALNLLRRAQAAGQGDKPVMQSAAFGSDDALKYLPTVDQALGSGKQSVIAANQRAATIIAANVDLLKRETGITDADIIHVPVLFHSPSLDSLPCMSAVKDGGALAGREPAPKAATATTREREAVGADQLALIPNALNSLVFAPDQVLAGRQFSVLVDGRDIFADAVSEAYAAAGMRVSWINDMSPYHAGGGEVHCGTNSLREISAPWWTLPTTR